MKKLWVAIAPAILILIQFSPASAERWEQVAKEKKVHHQYTVQDMDKLEIDNVHGSIHINTWDKNVITVDVTITAKARSESDAQEVLDRISIVNSSNESGGHRIFYRTVLEPTSHNVENSNMTIDYTINAPRRNAIDITNKFGDVYLGDFSGKMRMDVSYGALDLQTVSGNDNRIKVAFGSAMISSIEAGIFEISYSNLTIDKAGDIDVTNKFGKTDVASATTLKIDQHYGNVELGAVGAISGYINYADIAIDNLKKSFDLTLKYCGRADVKSVGPNVDLVKMEAQYSNMDFRFAEGANLSMDITTTYSTVKKGAFSKSLELTSSGNKEDWKTEHYRGKIGSGAGNMTIEAHYSNINFK
jgi:DUF4097 and DUF4098 domain-containing protein YvlB